MADTNVDFPKVGAPALRALAGAGYTQLTQLAGVPRRRRSCHLGVTAPEPGATADVRLV